MFGIIIAFVVFAGIGLVSMAFGSSPNPKSSRHTYSGYLTDEEIEYDYLEEERKRQEEEEEFFIQENEEDEEDDD